MKSQRSKVAAGLLAGAAAVLLLQSGEESAELKRERQQLRALGGADDDDENGTNETAAASSPSSSSPPRPIMHTFYRFVDDDDMSGSAKKSDLLEAWEEAWHDAGWDTRILTLEDAKANPSYDKYLAYMDEYGYTDLDPYNAMCFWRWFAMATVDGGGWMADYDTFPVVTNFTDRVGDNLPNEGKLTVHQWFVPALVSGSKREWDRVSKLLLDTMEEMDKDKVEHKWSDMQALVAVNRKDPTDFVSAEPWAVAPPAWVARDSKPKDMGGCTLRDRGAVALHCAHADIHKGEKSGLFDDMIEEGKLRKDVTMMEQRSVICKELVAKWEEACGDSQSKAGKATASKAMA